MVSSMVNGVHGGGVDCDSGAGVSHELVDDVTRVLTWFGMSASEVEAVVRAVSSASADDAAAVEDILQARTLERAAWIAPRDGYLRSTESGYLLTEHEDAPLYGYLPRSWSDPCGAALDGRNGDHTGWRFAPLDGRTLRVPDGAKVAVGDVLTDGQCDLGDLLQIFGRERAMPEAAQRLAAACALDRTTAERVVQPLFETVRFIEVPQEWAGDPELDCVRAGDYCTRRYFKAKNGRNIGLMLRDLPASADPRLHAVAAIADDKERADAWYSQRLWRVADDAGLTQRPFASGRPVYRGYSLLARMIEKGGALPAGSVGLERTWPLCAFKLSEEEHARIEARLRERAAGGFLDLERLAEIAVQELSVGYHPLTVAQSEALAEQVWLARLREQEGWEGETDPERITRAFAALEEAGIAAREAFACCTSCGHYEMRDGEATPGARGYVFYHGQCVDRAATGGGLTLYYGSLDDSSQTTVTVGRQVVATLREAGLPVAWNGDPARAIEVTPIAWRKRLVDERPHGTAT
jgi:hypothetical protein